MTATAKSNATCSLSTYENYSPALKLKASGSDFFLVNIPPPIVAPPPFKLSSVRSTKLRTDFTRDNAIYRLQPSFCMRYAITKVALLCQKKLEVRLWLLKQQKSSHHDIMTSGFSVQKTTGINQDYEDLVAWQLVGNRSMWTSKQAWFGTTKWFCDLPSVHTLLRQVPWTKAKRLLNLSSKHVSSKLSQPPGQPTCSCLQNNEVTLCP